jgi:threonine/homoserine/homoserine lactone efflux protein
MERNKAIFQVVWGVLLLLMGVLLFLQVPQVMARIAQIEHFVSIKWIIRIMVYLIALLLIGGGGRKLYENYKHLKAG